MMRIRWCGPGAGLAGLASALVLVAAASAAAVGVHAPDSASAGGLGRADSFLPHSSAEGLAHRPAVVASRIIGHSVNGHALRAYELGNPKAATKVVAIGAIHGNETGGLVVLGDLRDGRPVKGVDLWVVPRANPDGVLRNDRHNAHGVDLNRNFPVHWQAITGYYYSGPAPSSEPETRALERFLSSVDPNYVLSFHSPFRGVDVSGAKDRPFSRTVARHLNLPIKKFNCSGACHGTLSQWFNKRHAGACVTVEFGASPSSHYLHVKAPRGLLHAIGGHF